MRFQHRHVLVRRDMKDVLGTVLDEDRAHPRFVGDVSQTRGNVRGSGEFSQFAIDGEQAGLRAIDDH
jgi:hypothetical protein